jgi:transposase
MSIAAVASLLGTGWDTVKDIVKSDLKKRAKKRSLKRVKRIAIDEIAVKKGHRYMTIVLDLDTGWVIYTAEGKGKESLKNFFKLLARSGAKLLAIAMDMSESYRSAVKEYWPHPVAIINDHYHLVANMNAVLDSVRRDEQNKLEAEGKDVIKGARYLLLYSKENLAKRPEKLAKLNDLLAANETLNKAYLLKEELRLFWQQESRKNARVFVLNWIKSAMSVSNKHLTKFAETIRGHLKEILAWYKHRITTGPLEGTNNKIKVLKRMAYGYRDLEFFGLKILFIHEAKYQLAGA